LGRQRLHPLRPPAGSPTSSPKIHDNLPPENLARIRRLFASDYFSCPSTNVSGVTFNTALPPFDDVKLRQALNMAIDRESFADRIFQGYFLPASGGMVPPGIPGHTAGIGLVFDPDAARRKLSEAGYPAGAGFPSVDFLAVNHPLYILAVNTLCFLWQKHLGISIKPRFASYSEVMAIITSKRAAMWLAGWMAAIPDPYDFLQMNVISQWANWQHEEYEEIVENARRTMDFSLRMALYHHAEEILVAEVPAFPLAHARLHMLLKPWVKKYPVSPLRFAFYKDVVIEE
jgi:oligopeptide transport system substrate-binding protein